MACLKSQGDRTKNWAESQADDDPLDTAPNFPILHTPQTAVQSWNSTTNTAREKFGCQTVIWRQQICKNNVISDGWVAERLKAPVLKTGRGRLLVGSNPTPSANAAGKITKNGGSARGVSVCSVAGRAAIPAHHVSFGTVIFFVRSFDCRNKT